MVVLGQDALITNDEPAKNKATCFHDLCRLLHLRIDPGSQTTWNKTMLSKTRKQLDVKADKLATPAEDAAMYNDPYNVLADMFNDYDQYQFEKALEICA